MSESSFTVWLKESAFDDMVVEGESKFPHETGGVVMGYWSDDSRQVVVTEIIGPGTGAEHRPMSFLPDGRFHIDEIARIYRESGRVLTYLGDWHTHPDGSDEPSDRDRKTLNKIARDPDAQAQRPLMAILHGRSGWQVGIWVSLPAKSWFRPKRTLIRAHVLIY